MEFSQVSQWMGMDREWLGMSENGSECQECPNSFFALRYIALYLITIDRAFLFRKKIIRTIGMKREEKQESARTHTKRTQTLL